MNFIGTTKLKSDREEIKLIPWASTFFFFSSFFFHAFFPILLVLNFFFFFFYLGPCVEHFFISFWSLSVLLNFFFSFLLSSLFWGLVLNIIFFFFSNLLLIFGVEFFVFIVTFFVLGALCRTFFLLHSGACLCCWIFFSVVSFVLGPCVDIFFVLFFFSALGVPHFFFLSLELSFFFFVFFFFNVHFAFSLSLSHLNNSCSKYQITICSIVTIQLYKYTDAGKYETLMTLCWSGTKCLSTSWL